MKNIIHMKIPMLENATRPNQTAIDPKTCGQWTRLVVDMLKKNLRFKKYIVLCTPFDCECVDGDAKVITIDCKEYSYNELKEIIERAEKR